MKVPTLPDGWWLAYIYPMDRWTVDARSLTHKVEASAEELEEAIEMAIAKIKAGDWEEDGDISPRSTHITGLTLSRLGFTTTPIRKRGIG